jgi:hypothetical protein
MSAFNWIVTIIVIWGLIIAGVVLDLGWRLKRVAAEQSRPVDDTRE